MHCPAPSKDAVVLASVKDKGFRLGAVAPSGDLPCARRRPYRAARTARRGSAGPNQKMRCAGIGCHRNGNLHFPFHEAAPSHRD
jgi:hypothetical protein